MPHFICTTCGMQYAESDQPSKACTICQDERQYAKTTGQQWTTLERLRLTNRISIKFEEAGLIGIGIDPHFAIGQRALFLRTPTGNILWDCIPLVDQAVIEMVGALGGISAIAISHPHYYSLMVEWSRAFGGVPIYLHAADQQWVMRPDKASEALYLRDPDENGVELYWDRPQEAWPRTTSGELAMFTRRLDLNSLLNEVLTTAGAPKVEVGR